MFSINASVGFEPIFKRDKLASTIKSARNTEIQDIDPLAKLKDDGSPNFIVHP